MPYSTDPAACTNPALVEDIDVVAYAEGDGRPEFAHHLAECSFCREQLAEYQALSRRLTARLSPTPVVPRQKCPSPQLINDYLFRLLDGPVAAEIKGHLSGCRYCQAEQRAFESENRAYQTAAAANGNGLRHLFRVVTAVLLPPPSSPRLAFRDLDPRREEEARQTGQPESPAALLEYTFEEGTIRLTKDYDRAGNYLTLTGRVKRQNYGPAQLEEVKILITQDEQSYEDKLDKQGRFNVQGLAASKDLSLQILFDDLAVIVPDISPKS